MIATRLEVTFDFDRRGLFLVVRVARGEGLEDDIDTHFHDRDQVEDLSEQKIRPLVTLRCRRNGWTRYRPMRIE